MAVTRTRSKAQPRRIPVRGDSTRRRQDHSQELAQDYVEMIAELITKTGEARLTDLARGLGVTHVTANRTLKRLQRQGLVTSQPYRSIFLTSNGRSLAKESRDRHETVVRFLIALGVPEAIAESDAEGIEHHVSSETLAAFVRHLRGGTLTMADLRVEITCPLCAHVASETMPTDQCIFFYECLSCHTVLKPKPGDCCVYCSYGDKRCPFVQDGCDCPDVPPA
jgi:DtxR family manganese transport transcriptional regulator